MLPKSLSSWLRAAAALLLLIAGSSAQDESRTLSAFTKLFRAKPDKPVSVADREAGLATTKQLDSPAVADAVVEAWLAVEVELTAIDAERTAAIDEMAALLKGKEFDKRREMGQKEHARYKELTALAPQLRERCDALRGLQQHLTSRIGELARKDSLLWLLAKVLPGKKHSLPLRLAAARALGGGAVDVLPEIAIALSRAKEPEEQLALIDAMAMAGKAAQLHATPVIALLAGKEEAVRERAALALARIAVPEAVEPMIALAGSATGQTRLRILGALEVLTGQQFGSNFGSWQAWWQSEGAAVKAGQVTLGKGTTSQRRETDKNYYFGIPQSQSSSILYVIDCSGSMTKEIALKTAATGTKAGDAAEPEKTTRIEGCKKELISALGLLQKNQRFAILYYNDLPHFWQPKLQLAEPATIEQAQAFVRTLQAASSTNIHDSLEKGFSLVGRGARDKYYGMELDTIFLLTDGTPTTPDGKADSTDKILESVRLWNPLQRVTIHTIGIGGELNDRFLGQLAKENGGEYKKF